MWRKDRHEERLALYLITQVVVDAQERDQVHAHLPQLVLQRQPSAPVGASPPATQVNERRRPAPAAAGGKAEERGRRLPLSLCWPHPRLCTAGLLPKHLHGGPARCMSERKPPCSVHQAPFFAPSLTFAIPYLGDCAAVSGGEASRAADAALCCSRSSFSRSSSLMHSATYMCSCVFGTVDCCRYDWVVD